MGHAATSRSISLACASVRECLLNRMERLEAEEHDHAGDERTAGLIAMGVGESTAFAIAIAQRLHVLPTADLGLLLTSVACPEGLCLS